ncbi:helical backbone metal receptor [Kitasatospora sp. NPDC057541]|uniref:helical backbone metal receptor n=1 Tax=unclassified Kitasatospora TaxID=2633591 RepID=UPI0036C5384A
MGPGPVRRVVSLVPSLTEAVAASAKGLLAGATDWCSHPAGLDVPRIGGTKNPDVARITALAPDLVIANDEENRRPDLDALRAAGLPVWVTDIRTLDQAFRSLDRLLTVGCGLPRPPWLDAAEAAWAALDTLGASDAVARSDAARPAAARTDVRPLPGPARRAVVPIWRRPWMVLGHDTFAGDLLRRLGLRLPHAEDPARPERYPAVPLPDLLATRPDLVVLPDEPYRFTADDGPECFPDIPTALVSGRHLTWYGPSLAEAPAVLARQLARASVHG